MKRRSFLRIGCVLLGALLLGVSAGRAAVALAENKRLRDGFVKHPYLVYPYEEHIPMEEMDISQLTGAMDILAVAAAETDNRFLLTLTRDICYYDKANAAKPALILKKGTRVYPWLTGDPWFYGFSSSLPTYYHGWRYNRPLLQEGQSVEDLEETYYYIRLDDLRYLMREADIKVASKRAERPPLSTARLEQQFLWVDMYFYEKGVYVSPDLLRNPMDSWNIWITAAGFVLILAGVLLHVYARRNRSA